MTEQTQNTLTRLRMRADTANPKATPDSSNAKRKFLSSIMGTTATSDAIDFLRELPRGCARAVVTSPPYNLPRDGEKHDATTSARYAAWLALVIAECARVLEPSGFVAMVVGGTLDGGGHVVPIDYEASRAMTAADLTHFARIAWTGRPASPGRRFTPSYETILVFTKGAPSFKGDLGRDLWDDIEQISSEHPEKTRHPDAFPEALVERILRSLTDTGNLVIDPFAGTGTTERVCRRMERKYVGCDLGYEDVRRK